MPVTLTPSVSGIAEAAEPNVNASDSCADDYSSNDSDSDLYDPLATWQARRKVQQTPAQCNFLSGANESDLGAYNSEDEQHFPRHVSAQGKISFCRRRFQARVGTWPVGGSERRLRH